MTDLTPQGRPDSPINAGVELMALTIETLAQAVYDAEDDLSGDHIATVIMGSEHLFPTQDHFAAGSTPEAYRQATKHVCQTVARAILTAIEQAGYVVVQREPTEEMLDAFSDAPFFDATREIWMRMLSTAAKVQHSGGEGR